MPRRPLYKVQADVANIAELLIAASLSLNCSHYLLPAAPCYVWLFINNGVPRLDEFGIIH